MFSREWQATRNSTPRLKVSSDYSDTRAVRHVRIQTVGLISKDYVKISIRPIFKPISDTPGTRQ